LSVTPGERLVARREKEADAAIRLSLVVASGTWLLAVVVRALANARVETVPNPRQILSPPLAWLKSLGPASIQVPVISSVAVLLFICAIVLVWWRLRLPRLAALGLGLFVGGAAANTIEQTTFGSVTDYIPISWPNDYILNIADIGIMAGGVLLAIALVGSLRGRR
jgi:Signal peptidase (SPase) II